MTATARTCPQCVNRLDGDARFCPRCGLAVEADDAGPVELQAGGHRVIVRDRLAYGDVANLYRCDVDGGRGCGVLKIARAPAGNKHLQREADVLVRLRTQGGERVAPFLPRVVANLDYASAQGPSQRANVLDYHDGIESPDELYPLAEVRNAYPDGIDARDMAWMWRRLLTVLGFIHEQRIVHTAVTPDHVLIEPREHKLVLVGWCGAVQEGQAPALSPARWRDWGGWSTAASSQFDLAMASRTMSHLLAPDVEPAIARHMERAGDASSSSAMRLLDDFDRLIDALWGPRQFRHFEMPRRA